MSSCPKCRWVVGRLQQHSPRSFIPHAKTENRKTEIQQVLLAESVLHICSVHRLSGVTTHRLLLWWWPGDLALITSPHPDPCPTLLDISTCSLQSVTVETNWRFKPKLPEPEYQSDNDCPSTFPNRPIKRMRVTRNMVINVYDDWEWIMLLWCRVLCHWTIMTRGNPARHSQEKH